MNNRPYRPGLLDVPISVFSNAYQTNPEGITTLRRIVSTGYYRSEIETIRTESNEERQKERKKQLRAFTPVALLNHRQKGYSSKEQISQQWPLLTGDVDQQDNPGVDMSELKKHLCRLPYVLLCAYSVRGGLWFVVRLPENQTLDTLAAHFRYLQRLFSELFGVTLDASKGSNPTALRYVSYDAEPYFNEVATVMSGHFTPQISKPQLRQKRYVPDEGELLVRLIRFVESANDGNRHDHLLKAATVAGGYVATGQIDEQTAVYALETVANEWPDFRKSQGTIRDGIRYGLQKPIYPDAISDRPPPPLYEFIPRPEPQGLKRSTNQLLVEVISRCMNLPVNQVPLYKLSSQ